MWQSELYVRCLLFLCIHVRFNIHLLRLTNDRRPPENIHNHQSTIFGWSSRSLWQFSRLRPWRKKYAVTRLCSRHELSRASLRFLRVATRETEDVEGWKKDGEKGKKWRRRGEKTVVETRRDVERNNDSRCRRVRRSELVISHSAMR